METSTGRLTPFMLFYTEHRDAVKARINRAAARPEDISKEITRLWRSLAPERTRDYCLLSNLYAESLAKHGSAARAVRSDRHSGNANTNTNSSSSNSSNSSSSSSSSSSSNPNKRKLGKQPRRKKDPRLPKPPVSSFMWFSRHHRAILKNEHRELSFCEIGKTVGALWKAAAAAEKRPFDDLAAEDKSRYARELAEYKVWLVKTQGSKDGEEDEVATATVAAATVSTATVAIAAAATPAAGTTTPPPPMRPSTSSLVPSSPSPSSSSSSSSASMTVATPAAAAAVAAAAAAAPVSPVPVVSACAPSVPENGGRRAAVGVSSAPQRFAPHPSSFSPSSFSPSSFSPSAFSPSEYSQHQMVSMHAHKRQRRERVEPALPSRNATLNAVPMSHESVLDVVTDSGGAGRLSHRQHIGGKADNVVIMSRSAHYRV